MKKLIILLLLPFLGVSQSTTKAPNFYDIQTAFYQKHGADSKEKKDGEFKQFKRWEWFWSTRVNKDGTFPKNDIIWKEWQKYAYKNSAKIAQSNINASGSWTSIGPTNVESGYVGIGRVNCITFDPTNPNVLWAGTPAGGLWKSLDNGVTWSTNTDNLPVLGVSDIVIDFTNASTMYLATGDGDGGSLWSANLNTTITSGDTKSIGILKSTNGGTTWTQVLSANVQDELQIRRLIMDPTNANVLLAATSTGIQKTIDGGVTWTSTQVGYFIDIEFHPINPQIVYASTYSSFGSSKIYKSIDGGSTWQYIDTPGGNRINIEVTPNAPNSVWLLAANGSFAGMFKSIDSGQTFTTLVNPTTATNLLGYAEDGSDNGGQGDYTLSFEIDPTDENIMYVGGVNVWKTIDGGTTWSIKTHWYSSTLVQPVHADVHELKINPANGTLYNCNDGGIYYTSDKGDTWTDISNGLVISQFYRISTAQTAPNIILGGLQDNSAKKFINGQWSHAYDLGDGMDCIIDYSDESIFYAASYYGGIARSLDSFTNDVTDVSVLTSTGGWITPYLQSNTDPMALYAAYSDIYYSSDRGSSWQALSQNLSSGTLSYLALSKLDNSIYTGTFYTIYASHDGGSSWNNITNNLPTNCAITNVAVSPLDAQEVYVTLSPYEVGEKVYKSVNGGASWTNISGSLPNVPVNCITIDKDNQQMYVGTDVGVFHYNTTTSDWELYNTGLPVVPVTDIEIQYATNKLYVATYGRGIWETSKDLTAIKEIKSTTSKVKLYPNPTNGVFTIDRESTKQDKAMVYDYLGQQVKKIDLLNKQTKIDISSLSQGVYYVAFESEGYKQLNKVVYIK